MILEIIILIKTNNNKAGDKLCQAQAQQGNGHWPPIKIPISSFFCFFLVLIYYFFNTDILMLYKFIYQHPPDLGFEGCLKLITGCWPFNANQDVLRGLPGPSLWLIFIWGALVMIYSFINIAVSSCCMNSWKKQYPWQIPIIIALLRTHYIGTATVWLGWDVLDRSSKKLGLQEEKLLPHMPGHQLVQR